MPITTEDTRRRTTDKGRFYTDNVGKGYWSVTTILQAVPKWALMGWYARVTAEAALEDHDRINRIKRATEDNIANWSRFDQRIVDYLRRAPERYRDEAAARGSWIHAAIEAQILGKPWPEAEVDTAMQLKHFADFVETCKPVFHAAEMAVFNATESYAGMLDSIATFPAGSWEGLTQDTTLLLDVKTGKGVYDEVALQLAAYMHAEFYETPDWERHSMLMVDGAAVLHIRPEGWRLVPVRANDQVFNYFLIAREMFRWLNEDSKACCRHVGYEHDVAGCTFVAKSGKTKGKACLCARPNYLPAVVAPALATGEAL